MNSLRVSLLLLRCFLLQTFFFNNTGLQNQSCLFKVGSDGKEVLLLDPNTLSTDGTAALGTYGLSESGALLAYGVARSGSDWNTISVMRVSDGVLLEDKVEWVKFSGISWTHDEKGFFYSRYPQPQEFVKATPEEEADPNFKRGTETASVKNHMVRVCCARMTRVMRSHGERFAHRSFLFCFVRS